MSNRRCFYASYSVASLAFLTVAALLVASPTTAHAQVLTWQAVYKSSDGDKEQAIPIASNDAIPRQLVGWELTHIEVVANKESLAGMALNDLRNISLGLTQEEPEEKIPRRDKLVVRNLEGKDIGGKHLEPGKKTRVLALKGFPGRDGETRLVFDGRAVPTSTYLCMLELLVIEGQAREKGITDEQKKKDELPKFGSAKARVEYSFCEAARKRKELTEKFEQLYDKASPKPTRLFGAKIEDADDLLHVHKRTLLKLLKKDLDARLSGTGSVALVDVNGEGDAAKTNVAIPFTFAFTIIDNAHNRYALREVDNRDRRELTRVVDSRAKLMFVPTHTEKFEHSPSLYAMTRGKYSVRLVAIGEEKKDGEEKEGKAEETHVVVGTIDRGGEVELDLDLKDHIGKAYRLSVVFTSGSFSAPVWQSVSFEVHRLGFYATGPGVTEVLALVWELDANDPAALSTLPVSYVQDLRVRDNRGIAVTYPILANLNTRRHPRLSSIISGGLYAGAILMPIDTPSSQDMTDDTERVFTIGLGPGLSIFNAFNISYNKALVGPNRGGDYLLIGVSLQDFSKLGDFQSHLDE